jgi:hypothetical protein
MQPATPTIRSGLLALEVRELAERPEHALLGVLADGAGVERSRVRVVGRVDQRHAGALQHAGHELGCRPRSSGSRRFSRNTRFMRAADRSTGSGGALLRERAGGAARPCSRPCSPQDVARTPRQEPSTCPASPRAKTLTFPEPAPPTRLLDPPRAAPSTRRSVPVTGQPDFGTIDRALRARPSVRRAQVAEAYIWSFRNEGTSSSRSRTRSWTTWCVRLEPSAGLRVDGAVQRLRGGYRHRRAWSRASESAGWGSFDAAR